MNSWQYLIDLNSVCHFTSRERTGKASNSELKRWIKNQALTINNRKIKWDEDVDFPVNQCTIFTKLKRITIL